MSKVLGLKCKMYRGTAGSTATTEMKNVKDVTLNMSTGEADVTTRAADGWRCYLATLKEATVEFAMLYDTEDADFQAMQSAFLGNTEIAILVGDDDGNGLDMDCVVTAFNCEQPLEDAYSVSVTLRPTTDTRAPEWHGASTSNS